jgi:hypothetical protein
LKILRRWRGLKIAGAVMARSRDARVTSWNACGIGRIRRESRRHCVAKSGPLDELAALREELEVIDGGGDAILRSMAARQ